MARSDARPLLDGLQEAIGRTLKLKPNIYSFLESDA